MSLGGIVFFLALLSLTALVVVAPLLRRSERANADDIRLQKQQERLLVYYERVLTNLRDLDEDHATGKMPTADYASERELWMRRGVQVLRALDSLDDHSIVPEAVHDEAAIDEAIDRAIENAIADYRGDH
jgi:hypothetical protein